MADALFEDPRLAELYDELDRDRADLEAYAEIIVELAARSVLDVGCGTGTFACMLAARGLDVIGVDPAAASLDVARRKRFADKVRWILGDAAALPELQVDAVTMTGNVAQVFVEDHLWLETLGSVRAALRPSGHFVFESRVPEDRAWLRWDRTNAVARAQVKGLGAVESWPEVTEVTDTTVTFTTTFSFEKERPRFSQSTLRFRSVPEIRASLEQAALRIVEIRDAPDRPGREHVFVAVRSDG